VIALLLAGVATNQPGALVRLLTTLPVLRLGSYSYSLYLLHVPIVLGISRTVAAHYAAPGLPAFWVTLGLGVPISLLTARWFAAIFEIPFQRHRLWAAMRGPAPARRGETHRPLPPSCPQRRPVESPQLECGVGGIAIKMIRLDATHCVFGAADGIGQRSARGG
jgi:hypothetical protein